uniref:Uncharacterized protein n=1 Tax=Canis lupus familiaris TaxID=9615 RepID=A0A8C0YW56_CANLF
MEGHASDLPVQLRDDLALSLGSASGSRMMFWTSPQLSCNSFPEGLSTVFWVAAMARTLVLKPSMMLKWSWVTLAREVKQLVVQEALLTILRELSYFSWFMPITNMGASAEDGDGLPIDDKFPILSLDRAVEFAVGRIILEHVHHVVEVKEGVIDGNNIHFARVKSALVTTRPIRPNPFTPAFTVVSQGHGLHCTRSGGWSNRAEQRDSILCFD